MRANCKSCGAPLHNEKCDYCGTIYGKSRQTPQQSSSTLNHNIPQSDMENINPPSLTQNRLTINTVAGVLAIINVMVIAFYNMYLLSLTSNYLMLGLLAIAIILLMITALVIHIIGLVNSKKHGIPITGHILGIIGAAIVLLTLTILSFLSIILFFIAAIIIFTQKNVKPPTTHY